MSKERIDDIKEAYEMNKYDENYGLGMNDVEWLIEQAERVQELERTTSEYLYSSKYLLEQNKRYREAIENIRSVKGGIGMRTRITVVFDGAKYDYEVLMSKETIISELNNVKSVRGFLHFTDINDNEIRITPSKIPLLEVVSL